MSSAVKVPLPSILTITSPVIIPLLAASELGSTLLMTRPCELSVMLKPREGMGVRLLSMMLFIKARSGAGAGISSTETRMSDVLPTLEMVKESLSPIGVSAIILDKFLALLMLVTSPTFKMISPTLMPAFCAGEFSLTVETIMSFVL